VLRLANSAFYGIPRTITNINQAIVILGFKVINTMVLSLTVFDMFPESDKNASLFDRKAFWLHSLSCGLIAKLITQNLKTVRFDPEEAFCAGLLHDIGKVIMEQYMHNDFHKSLKRAKDKQISMVAAEYETFGFSHGEVAQWLTSSWCLPTEIQLPLIYHHNTNDSTQCEDVVQLIHVADWICYLTGMSIDSAYPQPVLNKECLDNLMLNQEDIEKIKVVMPEEIKKVSIFFEIK
jgi:HD-like signal output (HDOD) protein